MRSSECLAFGVVLTLGAAAARGSLQGLAIGYEQEVVSINLATGHGTQNATAEWGTLNSLAMRDDGTLWSHAYDYFVVVNPATGETTPLFEFDTQYYGGVRGIAFANHRELYVLANVGSSSQRELYRVDAESQGSSLVATYPGPGFPGQSLEWSPDGFLYSWAWIDSSTERGMGLVRIDPTTGEVTDVNPSVNDLGVNIQSLALAPDGRLFALTNPASFEGTPAYLYEVDPALGTLELVGEIGTFDVRGLVIIPAPGASGAVFVSGLLLVRCRRRRQ